MERDQRQNDRSSGSIGKYVLIGFMLVAGFFLFTEHRAHLFGILPYLLLAACPLMHLFGHRHGGHGGHGKDESKSELSQTDQSSGHAGHDHR